MVAATRLDPHPVSAGKARDFVATTLGPSRDSKATEVAVLLTSELVSNAIMHARSPVTLTVTLDDDRLSVAVADDSATTPAPRDKTIPSAASGRGLQIVDALATNWGVDPAAGGKTVWFELSLS
jgi:anti-sigma regulatory factor (Ser/Thr protein kinase)